ncbi:NADH:ubiquinone oxidoreductase [Leptotrichia sp. oral taxon 847]|nr:NADH:ubiquinone oxidoreductase [Leptotrichia sp. oral taxon 847]
MFRNKKRLIEENMFHTNIDIFISLIPILIASFIYTLQPLITIITSTIGAELVEWIYLKLYKKKNISERKDTFSSTVIGVLTGMMLPPFIPFYIAFFAGAMAVIFGKNVYGDINKKIFNPIVLGKLFVITFFSEYLMPNSPVWGFNEALRIPIDDSSKIMSLFITSRGMIGTFSVLAVVIGAIYLIIRKRITWHIPFAFFVTIFIGLNVASKNGISVTTTLGEFMFLGVFVMTDKFTSPEHSFGKIFFGAMIGISTIVFWFLGVQSEAIIYSILILNIFTRGINIIYKPNVFGNETVSIAEIIQGLGFAILIMILVFVFAFLHNNGFIPYLVYIYLVFGVWKLYNQNNED